MKNLITSALVFVSFLCSAQNQTRVFYASTWKGKTGDTIKLWIEIRRSDYKIFNSKTGKEISKERYGFIGTDDRFAYYWITVAHIFSEDIYLIGSAGKTGVETITNYGAINSSIDEERIVSDENIVSVFYNTNGQIIESPNGFYIRKDIYKNGRVVTTKSIAY